MQKIILLIFQLCCFSVSAQNLTFSPTHPLPGESIQIEYRPINLPVTQVENFQMVAYFFTHFSIGPSEVKELQWTIEDDHFRAEVATPDDAAALLIRILPIAATAIDASTGAGYVVPFYQSDRTTLGREAICAQAQLYAYYGNEKGFQKSTAKADSLFAQVFDYPELVNDVNWYKYFLYYEMDRDLITSQKLVENWSEKILEKENPSVEEILACFQVAYVHGAKQSSRKFKNLSKKLLKFGARKHPNDIFKSVILSGKAYEEPSLQSKKSYLKKMKTYQANGADNQAHIDMVLHQLAITYFQSSPKRAISFFNQIGREKSKYTCTTIANISAGTYLDDKGLSLTDGLLYADKGIEMLQADLKNAASQKPSKLTERWYRNMINQQLNSISQSQALILFKLGEKEKALAIQNEICARDHFSNTQYIERYCLFLELTRDPEETLNTLLRLNKNNLNSAGTDQQFWRLFFKQGGTTEEFNTLLADINTAANTQDFTDIANQMVQIPAPTYTLKNLLGEKVSSEDLKGKIVILDFWASWCGPCTSSFPAMQQLVDFYADRNDIVFLFIDVWERGKDKIKTVKTHTVNRGYRFNVLLDTDNQVVQDFQVSSIPTKFVIDKVGNIRFVSKGFGGNNHTMGELSLMIEMVANH